MQHIEDFFQSYQSAWLANSASQIESFWDTSEPNAFYKAEEIPHIMTNWDDLRGYWKHNEDFNKSNELSFSNIVSKPMGEDRILVGTHMRWDIDFADDARNIDGSAFAWAGKAMGGENHVMACLKKAGKDWKLTAWVEAPDAPILYMADLYMKNVRPGFPTT
jgi:hypothetical protein